MDSFSSWISHYGVRAEFFLGSVAIIIAGAAIVMATDRSLRRLLGRLSQRLHLTDQTITTTARIVGIALWAAIGFVLLGFWGISVGGLWTFLVSIAAVIGVGFLAVWTMISNITASLFITLWRPFRRGETVELLPENLKGRVIDRNLMFTILRAQPDRVLLVPNNMFFQRIFTVTAGENGDRYAVREGLDRVAVPAEREFQ